MTPEPRTPTDLQELLLGGPPHYTREQLSDVSGVSADQARRLWRAMGFADVGDALAFTDADLTALLRLKALADRGLIDDATAIDITRSLGQTTARLADWQVEALGRVLARRSQLDDDPALSPEELGLLYEDLAELLPVMERLLVHVWRRQLSAAVGRRLGALEGVEEGEPSTATVGFADLVGFTRLSRQLESEDLAALVERFEATSSDVVAATGARLVKTLGDEVLFVAEAPPQAAETAVSLHETLSRHPDIPQLRVGLATGDVLERMGDVFGSTVNLASRLTAQARPGSTLVDSTCATGLEGNRRFSVRAIAPRPVRGVGLVRMFALTRR
ncbi:MAG: adenylate/guanylate cyclase domain-containing protein [Candidatus Nanopelagicales bacterium]